MEGATDRERARTEADQLSSAVLCAVMGAEEVYGHGGPVFDVAVAPAGTGREGSVMTACADGCLRVWSPGIDDALPKVVAHVKARKEVEVLTASWGAAGLMASGAADGSVHLWRLPPDAPPEPAPQPAVLQLVQTLKSPSGHEQCYATEFDPQSGEVLYVGVENELHCIDLQHRQLRYTLPVAVTNPHSAPFAGGNNPENAACIFGVSMHEKPSRVLAMAVSDGTVRLLDRNDGQQVALVQSSVPAHVASVAVSRCGNLLATGSGTGGVAEVHDLRRLTRGAGLSAGDPQPAACPTTLVYRFQHPHQRAVQSVAWAGQSPTGGAGDVLLTGSVDGSFTVWDPASAPDAHVSTELIDQFPIYTTKVVTTPEDSAAAVVVGGGMPDDPQGTPFYFEKLHWGGPSFTFCGICS